MARTSFQKGYVFTRHTSRGKVFVIRYRARSADGKFRHRAETINSPRRKDAERVLADRLREINRGIRLPSAITFGEFASSHWDSYMQQSVKPSTRASYASMLKSHLNPRFYAYRLSEITALEVSEFIAAKHKLGLRPKTLLNLYVLLQRMLNLAVDLELIPSSPMRRVKKPKVERREKPILSPEQIRAVFAHTPEQHRALIVLLSLTGLRIGEALGLKWQDVDFERAKLYVRRSVWHGQEQPPKSRHSMRAKHLLPSLSQSLERHRELSCHIEPGDFVFANTEGRPSNPDDLRRRVLYKAMDRAGIERNVSRAFGFHLFRHSAGSELHEMTGDLKQTQSFLGHSGIGITGDVYLHLRPDAELEAMQALEKSVFPELCSTVLKKTETQQ